MARTDGADLVSGCRDCERCHGRVGRGDCPLVRPNGVARATASRRSVTNRQESSESGCPLLHRLGRREFERVAARLRRDETDALWSLARRWAGRLLVAVPAAFLTLLALSLSMR